MPAPPRSRRTLLIVLPLLAVLVAAGVWFAICARPGADAEAANNRGVGLMERFQFAEAAAAFEEAVAAAPDWRPGRVNLAIALLNTASDDNLTRAEALLAEVLREEPDHPHAHYCLGVIDAYRARTEEALAHFEAVVKKDPTDAGAWYRVGRSLTDLDRAPERSWECLKKARQLDPYMAAALLALAQHHRRRGEVADAEALEKEFQALQKADWYTETSVRYTEQGSRYAEVIGRGPAAAAPAAGPPRAFDAVSISVTLASNAQWAKALPDWLRRFGRTMTLLDYDRDGLLDVILIAAVRENGEVRNRLLRNEGNWRFFDVTAASGMVTGSIGVSASNADFDNDGWTDVVITGGAWTKAFRNGGNGRFIEMSATTGLDGLEGATCLACIPVDLDMDGDLDFALCRTGDKLLLPGGFNVLLNVGEAPPALANAPPLPLSWKFRPLDGLEALLVQGWLSGSAFSDLDGDGDPDLVITQLSEPTTFVLNDRLVRFRRADWSGPDLGPAHGVMVLDVNGDGRSDVLLLSTARGPTLLMSKPGDAGDDLAKRFDVQTVAGPSLRQAQAIDLNADGFDDVLGLSADGKPVLLHNVGGTLIDRSDSLGADWPADLAAIVAADFDGDHVPDLLGWSETVGLVMRRGRDNGNRTLRLELTGRRDRGSSLRTNADGIGARVIAQAGGLRATAERATRFAGLGQSLLPLELGIGRAAKADAVRIRWPEGIIQAELDVPAGAPVRIEETNRKGTSCPVLLSWDGRQFVYVTDFLGGGALGELGADGSTRPPRPEESVALTAQQLAPRDGEYVIKITEPMDEVLYLDRLQLVVIDHPPGTDALPDERFGGPPPTQELLTLGERVRPVAVRGPDGDVTAALAARDGRYAGPMRLRSWLGIAEEHAFELDLGERLRRFSTADRLVLVLAGWTDYPYPESIYAAAQAGVALVPPRLEWFDGSAWHPLGELGFPAGLPRVMTRELTGLPANRCRRLQITTNMQIHWDEVWVARRDAAACRTTTLDVSAATLARRGLLKEVSAGGALPAYDANRTDPVPVTRWTGRLTRYGDVTELLRQTDDRFVLCGPGDEITVRFAAAGLASVPAGWTRSFVLRTAGYCKDTAPFTATGGQVGPLPFRRMTRYPYGAEERPPVAQTEYDRRWNTRPAGGG